MATPVPDQPSPPPPPHADPEALEDKKDIAQPPPPQPPPAESPTPTAAAAAAATAPPTTAAPAKIEEKKKSFLTLGVLSLLIVFASVIELTASSVLCQNYNTSSNGNTCTSTMQYQIAVGAVSVVVSMYTFMVYQIGGLENQPIVASALTGFQMLWWFVAAIVLTFFGTYLSPSLRVQLGSTAATQSPMYANAYFATLSAMVLTIVAFFKASGFSKPVENASNQSRTPLAILVVASGFVMGAGIAAYDGVRSTTVARSPYSSFAISLGVVSLFFSILLLLGSGSIAPNMMKNAAIFMTVWWTVGFLVVTFGNPFLMAVGNGYYASIIALFSLVYLFGSLNKGKSYTPFAVACIIAFASLSELTAASIVCQSYATNDLPLFGYGTCAGYQAYQVALGAVGLFLALVQMALSFTAKEGAEGNVASSVIDMLQSAWWFVGLIVVTFWGNFSSPSIPVNGFTFGGPVNFFMYANAYFGTWFAWAASTYLAFTAFSAHTEKTSNVARAALAMLVVTSGIVMGAGIYARFGGSLITQGFLPVPNSFNSPYSDFAIALGVVSLFFSAVFLLATSFITPAIGIWIAYFLTLWWTVGGLVVTFGGPFQLAYGNGFFGSFASFILCVVLLSALHGRE